MSTSPKPTLRYIDWHRIALRQVLEGQRPSTTSLLEARGGSATTASAALAEFQEVYLPDLLSASLLGAPPEVQDLMADAWRRLAAAAKERASSEWDTERAKQNKVVERARADQAAAEDRAKQAAQALAEQRAAMREREVFIGSLQDRIKDLEAGLGREREEAADLGRLLAQAQRTRDQLESDLARVSGALDEQKAALASLRDTHEAALTRHAAELEQQRRDCAAQMDRAEIAHAKRLERIEAVHAEALERERAERTQAAALLAAERDQGAAAQEDAKKQLEALRARCAEAEKAHVAAEARVREAGALHAAIEARATDLAAERDRLLAQSAMDRGRIAELEADRARARAKDSTQPRT